ncbi:hypothetical protein [Ileibacterium valens]|uniref:hypothetical protein n=1 Tax=Ileibacterium valens TaxID=1862668 RepID=UPI002729BD78|nr:hypothetical protein [Ileibacterium valens]
MEESSEKSNTVSFCFAYLTGNKDYNIEGLKSKKKSGQEVRELYQLLEHLQMWSSASENTLLSRGKREDGFEVMKINEFLHPVFENFPFELDPETNAAVFRFGNYRLAAVFESGLIASQQHGFFENHVFYVAAFDWDFTLYNHGA